MNHYILEQWLRKRLNEDDAPSLDPMTNPGGSPGMGNGMGYGGQIQTPVGPDPSITNQGQQDMAPNPQENKPNGMPDVSNDPTVPDMPEELDEQDFERWKDTYFKESVKGDVSKLIDLIHQVRDMDLDSYPRKFVEDNLQICFLRQNANIEKVGNEVRKLIKQELDQNNPAVSVVNHMTNSLDTMPQLNNVFIKLKGLLGMKSDLHRKFIASLIGAVQVGSGANNEDIVYNEKDYSIRISTRYNDKWGKVDIGKWSLKEDDPERYLTDPEQKRLEEGSPEEKDVLRRRVVMESIADAFKRRAFIVNVCGHNGTIYTFGWDLSSSLRAAYTEGKLVVRVVESEDSEAMITDDGQIIPFVDLKIKYVKETGNVDASGKPMKDELDFMERVDGMLFLNAQLSVLREAASSFQGIVMKETPYQGNPSDLRTLQRCVPNASEILLRSC
jgi:hypothetical protein